MIIGFHHDAFIAHHLLREKRDSRNPVGGGKSPEHGPSNKMRPRGEGSPHSLVIPVTL